MARENEDEDLTGRLIQLRDFRQSRSHRALRDIRDYWSKQRNGEAVPYRADIRAAGISSAVDFAFIAERIAPGMARYRLAGQHLHNIMGMDVRGMPLATILHPSARNEFADILESVFTTPQIAELWLTAPTEYARPKLTARMLLLPLKSDLGDVARVFGGLITDGENGSTPRRFNLERHELSPVIAGGKSVKPTTTAKRKDTPSLHPASAQPSKIFTIATATPEQRRKSFEVISNREKT